MTVVIVQMKIDYFVSLFSVHQLNLDAEIIVVYLLIGKIKDLFRINNYFIVSLFCFFRYCDGDRDCPDGEDEPANVCQTGNYTCPSEFFKCDSGRCINKDFVCDGGKKAFI